MNAALYHGMRRRNYLYGLVTVMVAGNIVAGTEAEGENGEFDEFASELEAELDELGIDLVSHSHSPDRSELVVTTQATSTSDETFFEEVGIVATRYASHIAERAEPPESDLQVDVYETAEGAEDGGTQFAAYEIQTAWAADVSESKNWVLYALRIGQTVEPPIVDDVHEEEAVDIEEDEDEVDDEEGVADDPTYVDEVDEQVVLEYGETALISNGVEVTAHGIEVFEQLSDEVPEERYLFALLHLEALNDGEGENELPARTHPGVDLLFGDQQVGSTINPAAFRDVEYEQFEGDSVQAGVRREGHILYEVDEGYDQSTIDFLWQDTTFVAGDLEGSINVRWTDSAE